MTSRDIEWDKLDEFIEKSKETVSDFKRLEEINNEKKALHESESKLVNEENEIRKKYKQEYTKRLNDRLDDFGILTIVTSSTHDEGRIISVTKDEMKVRYSYNYGSQSDEIVISTKELKEKGYIKTKWCNRTMFIVDRINNPLVVFEIIKLRLKSQVGEQLNHLDYAEKEIADYTKRATDARKELEKYKKVSDSMITRIFNDISFGVTNLKINDILKCLPREICLYDENKRSIK